MLVWTNNGSYNAYHGSTYGSYRLPYPLVNVYIAIEAMAIEIVDLPIKHGDFPVRYVAVYRRVLTSHGPMATSHVSKRHKRYRRRSSRRATRPERLCFWARIQRTSSAAPWMVEEKPWPICSMVLVYMLTWLGYIDGIHVTIYSSTMDPMGDELVI